MIFKSWRPKSPVHPTADQMLSLRNACESISEKLRAAGYATPAFSERHLVYPHDFEKRLDLLTTFADLISEKTAGRDHKDLMWRFFGKMRFVPTSDVFDRIEDGHILEVYDMHGDQIFRNLNYFSVVSMSVEDLVSMNWKRDFKRSAKVTLQLVELLFRFATGYFKKTFDCAKVPVHIVEETIARHNRIELNIQFISPLKQSGKCVALLVVTRAKLLSVGD